MTIIAYMKNNQKISTAYEAKTRFGELLDKVRYTKEPQTIGRYGKDVAVILDIGEYRRRSLPYTYREWTQKAVSMITENYKPEKIILFGSMLAGELHEGSDIDLLIIKETGKRFPERVEEVLNIVGAEIPLEPLVYTAEEAARDPFVQEIMKKGAMLYEK